MKIKYIFSLIIICTLFFCTAPMVQALNLQDAFDIAGHGNDDPLDSMASTAGYDTNKTDLMAVVSKVINSVLGLLGVIFLVLTIYGGFLWMTARGNEQQVEKARETIVMAIIGIIIVLVAYSISYYVVYYLTEGTLKSA